MRSSGASRPEPLAPPAVGGRLLTLGNTVRIGLFVCIAAAVFFALVVAYDLGWAKGLLCLTATAALLVTALPLVLGRGRDLGEPIWLVVLLVAVGVTAKSFYIVFGPADRVRFLLLRKEPEVLLPAVLIVSVALLCLVLGYLAGNVRWRIPGAEQLRHGEVDLRRFVGVVGVLTVAGVYAFVVFTLRFEVNLDSLAALSSKRLVLFKESRSFLVHGYLRWGALLLETAFYLVFCRWAASGRRLRSGAGLVVVIFGLAAAAFPFFVSSRQGVMFLIIRVALIWLYLRGEPTPRKAFAVAAVSLALFGSMLAFRRGAADLGGIQREASVQGLLEATVGGRHFLDLTKTAHILEAVPRAVDYQYGRTLVTWLVAPIPRTLWPDKPRIGAGGDLTGIFGTVWTSGVPPGIVGELHLNFGLPGVLVGMLAVGLLLRSLYATFQPHFPEPAFVLIYTLLSTRLGLGMLSASVSGSAIRMFQEMIPLLAALLVVGWRPWRGSVAAAGAASAGAAD
jgi:hypothetical protein